MTFEQFQSTKEECSDLSQRLRDEVWGDEPVGGLIYCGCLFIEDTSTWKDSLDPPARWYTLIGRVEYASDDLVELERVLYQFAQDEGLLAAA